MKVLLSLTMICLLSSHPLSAQPPEMECGLGQIEVPVGLSHEQALKVLQDTPEPTSSKRLAFVATMVFRYQLTEAYPLVAKWLEQSGTSYAKLELFRTLVLADGGRLQPPDAQSFLNLLPQLEYSHQWKLAFLVLAALNSSRLDQRAFQAAEDGLQKLVGDDYGVRIERLNLQDLLAGERFRLTAAHEKVSKVLSLERSARLLEEARLYAEFDGGFADYLTPWAAAQLVRESWNESLDKQSDYQVSLSAKRDVIAALRKVITEIPDQDIEEDEASGIRLRLLRAASYFGDHLNAEELTFIEKNSGHQMDLLD